MGVFLGGVTFRNNLDSFVSGKGVMNKYSSGKPLKKIEKSRFLGIQLGISYTCRRA